MIYVSPERACMFLGITKRTTRSRRKGVGIWVYFAKHRMGIVSSYWREDTLGEERLVG